MNGIEFLKLINEKYHLDNEIMKKEPDFLKENFAKDIMNAILKNINTLDYDNEDMLRILSLFIDILNGDLDCDESESESDNDSYSEDELQRKLDDVRKKYFL